MKADFDWMVRDCERLRADLEGIPAHSLQEVLRLLGYRVVFSRQVPEGTYGYTHFTKREVVIASNLPERLACPSSERGVLHGTLACQLGHIRMHAAEILRGRRSSRWKHEANLYAGLFLVPYKEVMSQPEAVILRAGLLQDQATLWKQVLRLAEIYEVTGALMVRVLERYHLISMDRKTRYLRVPNILWRSAPRAPKVA